MTNHARVDEIPEEAEKEFLINASVLTASIKALLPFVSTEETRYYLNGIHFEMMRMQDTLNMVATDGHKLCVLHKPVDRLETFEGELKAIIPTAALRTIQQMLKGLQADCPISLRFTDKLVHVDTPDAKADFKLVDGDFPDYRRVIPSNIPAFTIGLGKAQAREAMKAVASHTGKEGMEWELTSAESPLVMKAEDKTVVVMPMRVSLPGEQTTDVEGEDSEADEALFERAKQLVINTGKASTSYCQRELKIGYNRAAHIIERLEGEGIVSAADHVGKRTVLVTPSEENEE